MPLFPSKKKVDANPVAPPKVEESTPSALQATASLAESSCDAFSASELKAKLDRIFGREFPMRKVEALMQQFRSSSCNRLDVDGFHQLCAFLSSLETNREYDDAATTPPPLDHRETPRTNIFNAADVNSDGFISIEELRLVMSGGSGKLPRFGKGSYQGRKLRQRSS